MQTKKLFSSLARTGTRLVIFVSMLMAALVSNVSPAFAAPRVVSVSVAPQVGALTYGTGGTATFVVTINKSTSNSLSANLSVTSALPAGASASFSPASFFASTSTASVTSTLTITTTAGTPAVTAQSFTVRAVRTTNSGDFADGNGSLTINKAPQTITFGAIPPKTVGDAFSVFASVPATGAVSFAASGNCTIAVATVTVGSAGSCTITASHAGDANYLAAPNVQQTFAINAIGAVTAFDLWAVNGSTVLPGPVTVPVFGYNTSNAAVTKPGGPVLTVSQGATISITLHNSLVSESTALLFQGQQMVPDTVGVAPGSSKTYTFTANQAGTFLYESGLMAGTQHQVAMGLYGTLVVRPAVVTQAYASASTAFTNEAVEVLSELDPALNNSANPASFDMRNYSPRYFLINGVPYPNTTNIPAVAGDIVLVRYVNAGLQAHAMSLLGLSQKIVGQDGFPYAIGHSMVAETIATGQTLDAIVNVPAATVLGTKFAIYDANMQLRNSATAGLGGMLTFIQVGNPVAGADTRGPLTSGVALTPSSTNGTANVALSANISDVTTGNSNVTAAEYFVDAIGANGTGTLMGGTFGAPTASVSATLSAASVFALSSGNHMIYVHGQDSAGNWGSVASALLSLDKTGPTTSAMSISPSSTNGTVTVSLTATADDSATGNNTITAAEYTIDGGTAVAMNINVATSTASLSATISAATVNALSSGNHTIAVHSQDAAGNWGALANITLNVDKAGPVTSGLSASPAANNGSTPFNTSIPAVRVFASFSDALSGNSKLADAEGFIDTVAANGTGFAFIPTDGSFNSPAEPGFADVPLAVINTLSSGNHTIYVHAMDAAGNWGSTKTLTYLMDRTAPTFTGVTASPISVKAGELVTLTITGATDPLVGGFASGVAGGEYWFGNVAPRNGGGTPFNGLTPSIQTGSLPLGIYIINVRVRDVAGNWSVASHSATFTVTPADIFGNGFETGNRPWGWTSANPTNGNTRLSVTAAAALIGNLGLQAQGNNTNFVQYNFTPAAATFDARFYFNPNGNTSTGQDILATAQNGATNANFTATQIFHVRYRMNAGQAQVQIQLGNTANAAWVNISNVTHYIEVVWQSGTSLKLYVDGVSVQTINTATAGSVASIRLGSVTAGTSSTNMYFDAFLAKRSVANLIGP